MDVRTKFVNKVYFRPRMKALEKYATNAEEIQMDVLKQLVSKAVDTEWGKKYGFANIRGYEDFANRLKHLGADIEPLSEI